MLKNKMYVLRSNLAVRFNFSYRELLKKLKLVYFTVYIQQLYFYIHVKSMSLASSN